MGFAPSLKRLQVLEETVTIESIQPAYESVKSVPRVLNAHIVDAEEAIVRPVEVDELAADRGSQGSAASLGVRHVPPIKVAKFFLNFP